MDLLTTNRLLAGIPAAELDILRPHATLKPLNRREILFEPNSLIDTVYFPIDGIVSLLTVMKDGSGVETATTGREGMVGMGVFHGVGEAAQQAVIQVPGQCYTVDAEVFRGLLPRMPTLSRLLHRFTVVLFSLAAQNSGCNRKHSIEERCSRWMLMVADRLDQTTFDMTHDFIAQMLGVRRASVTEALGSLEKRGLVKTSRGRIEIVNRAGLEACACECYGVIRNTVAQLLEDGASPA